MLKVANVMHRGILKATEEKGLTKYIKKTEIKH